MKRIISIAIISLLAALIMSSCSLGVKYTVYTDSALSDDGGESVNFKSIDNISFVSPITGESFERADAEKEKIFNINGKEIVGTYKFTRKNECESSTNSKMKDNMFTDLYIDESGKLEFNVNPATGRLIMFYDGNVEGRRVGGDFTEEEAVKLAKSFFEKTYGDQIFKEYKFDKSFQVNDTNTRERGFSVVYRRYIGDYATDDILRLRVNMQGEIYSVLATKVDLYRSADINVSKSQIKKAQKNLLKALDEKKKNVIEDDTSLCIDANGTLYLRVGVAQYKDGEPSFMNEYYINVN